MMVKNDRIGRVRSVPRKTDRFPAARGKTDPITAEPEEATGIRAEPGESRIVPRI
jgi:hypothetical protein